MIQSHLIEALFKAYITANPKKIFVCTHHLDWAPQSDDITIMRDVVNKVLTSDYDAMVVLYDEHHNTYRIVWQPARPVMYQDGYRSYHLCLIIPVD